MVASLDIVTRKITPILRQHEVARAAIFGSFARGTQRDDSDLDILVEFAGQKGLLDLASLRLDLIDALGRDVDVVTYRALRPRLREAILREQVVIL